MFAIIGGSGFEKFEEFEPVEALDRATPFGLAASGLKKVRVAGNEFLFISRHGENHEHLPSEVNYAANIFALKKHGAKAIVSYSAVGSLEKDCAPGDLVVPNQYIDRTKGGRRHTFLGNGVVGHVSLAHPTCEVMEKNLHALVQENDFPVHFAKTYVCIEGPYFSTKAESLAYRNMGANIIGMSNFPEYALAREAGLPYLPCCFVTDYDCWDDSIPHVTVTEVIKVMKSNNAKAFGVLKRILKEQTKFWLGSKAPQCGLRAGLFMPKERIPSDHAAWVELLMS
jgi:5'-methylthioadenosine phosphorylase